MFNVFGIRRRFEGDPAPKREDLGRIEPFSETSEGFKGSHSGRGGGGHRQKRGFVKFAVLDLLAEQPRHGYEIIKELEQRYSGFYRPSSGSIYPILQMLEEEGQLSSEEQDGKKIYTLTERGRTLLQEQQRRGQPGSEVRPTFPGLLERPSPVHQSPGTQSEIPEIKQSTMALIETIRYVAHFGTPAQVKELKKIIEATSRQIHALLAQENQESEER